MGIGKRIKEARENLGLTQNELAELVGVTGSAITNYEKETSHPKEPIMYKLFDALRVDANYLFQDEMGSNYPLKVSYDEIEHIKKYRSLDPYGQETVELILNRETKRLEIINEITQKTNHIVELKPEVQIPTDKIRYIQYYQRLASAGNGQVIFDDMPVDRLEIPDIPKYKRVSYAIGVNGHSMEPLYNDGDVLLIEPICQIDVGEIGIFIVGNEAYVKKLGEGELISLNKGYGNIPITEYSKCMGRVVDKFSIQQ